MKQYLTSPLLLSKPEAAKNLYIYLSVLEVAVSSAIIQEELGAQLPVFYTSKALLDMETRYSKIEKLILALVVATQKLRPYFQGHPVIFMTKYPLRSVLHSPDASQQVMKWVLELGQYSLTYQPHTTIKAQTLVDFIAEFTPSIKDAATQPKSTSETAEHAIAVLAPPNGYFWHLQVDRSSNHQGLGACLVLITPDDSILEQAITLSFKASNNEAEYEIVLAGLRLAKDLAVKELSIYSNSQLITNQILGDSAAKHPRMAQYLKKLRHSILIKYLEKPSIDEEPAVEVAQISTILSWQDLIIDYVVNGMLPADRLESKKLQMKVACYYMWNDMLIQRSFSVPNLRCLSPPDDLKILSSIHEDVCGNHYGGRSLA
ncbi:uncharacterized protein LOC125475154 [Pyrus x bretschneideri]|uniref:uncharacterized protein LOC125475154 n=1 Tax=Pyrus x bretschneideri TaxID=225117 RepID=UPI00203058A6|nr:uncharacterized protein LOC125475154 [Pyrus x bretschneideri]